MNRGLFITFEGGDGSGKTTQAEILDTWLRERGETTLRSREPGGTEVGEQLREIVLHHRGEISPRAEALLYAADRAQHIDTRIRPALERGEIVLQDRYIDSSLAYQGAGRALGIDEVRSLSVWASSGLWPDLTILLDLDPDRARERLDQARTRFDRLEAEKNAFHARVRTVFLELAEAEPARFLVLDATLSIDELAAQIQARVTEALVGKHE
ncbi:dTMP kinase [Mycetocola tolaasinivorans]|uniref:Thymidylate kinase n=1 Tax=Mycetocola tolaasinivorans TaxID=76635 RepID=A0A3L7A1X5_9MICO|nr:dTMP kinase [Mycetocola tolaasinivorans]RLP74157.1 dTMP kinase [Mycetocola tolaasinivorans]